MQSISVKVNDSVQTIAEAKVITKDGQPTIIKANRNANYELINDATGRGPDHIVTKRVGKDLHVSFEESAEESDLIIENFYDYDKSALIGQAESGQYHYYVPDTGLTQDYVTELVIGDIEGQALGGQGYPAPWWIGAEEGSRFGIMPWLVGLAGVVAAGVALKGDNDNNNSKAPVADTQTPTPQPKPLPVELKIGPSQNPTDAKLSIMLSEGAEKISIDLPGLTPIETTIDALKALDTNPASNTYDISINQLVSPGLANYSLSLVDYQKVIDNIKNGQAVKVTAKKEGFTDGKADDAVTQTPDVDAINKDGDNFATINPKPNITNASEVTVSYTPSSGNANPQTITATKVGDSWQATTGANNTPISTITTADAPADKPSIDPATGVISIPTSLVNTSQYTPVTAQVTKTTDNKPSLQNNVDLPDTPSVNIPTINSGETDYPIAVSPGKDNTSIVTSYTDEAGKPQTITVTKNPDGSYSATQDGKPVKTTPTDDNTPWVNTTNGVLILPKDSVDNNKPVTTIGKTDNGSAQDATNPANTPKVVANNPTATQTGLPQQADIVATPGEGNTKTSTTYTDEQGNTKTITATYDPATNTWTAKNPNEPTQDLPTTNTDGKTPYIDPQTGSITFPPASVDNAKPVTMVGEKEGGTPTIATASPAQSPNVAVKPPVTGQKDGDIVATPGDDNTQTQTTYTPEGSNKPVTITATKVDTNNDGVPDTWTAKNPNEPTQDLPTTNTDGKTPYIDPQTGSITFPPASVDNAKPVTMVGEKEGSIPSVYTIDLTDKTAPIIENIKVDVAVNGAGDKIVLTYDEPLDANNPPPATSFTVTVDGKKVIPTVEVSGNTVILNVPTPILKDQEVKVAYNKPADTKDAIQDQAGNDADSLTSTPAKNNSTMVDTDKDGIPDSQDDDDDNDGVTDADEKLVGTDPTNPTSDGNTPDGKLDSDGDGISNDDESVTKAEDPTATNTDKPTDKDGDGKPDIATAKVPTKPATAPDMTDATDTGVSNSDNITTNKTPSFSVPKPTDGEPVLVINGKIVESTSTPDPKNPNNVILTPKQPLFEGVSQIATATKKGSQVSDPSEPVVVTVDTTAPTGTTATLDPDSDTGVKGDNITSDTTPTIKGTGNKGDTVIATFPAQNGGAPEVVEVKVDEKGEWSATPTKELKDGANTISVSVKDPAGNVGVVNPAVITINTTKPTATATLDPNSDSGDKGDGITNNTMPKITGKGKEGDTIKVTFPSKDGTPEEKTVTVGKGGTWEVVPTKALKEGENQIGVEVTDKTTGTKTDLPVVKVTVDTTAPTGTTATLDPDSDTGVKGDNITSDTTPTIKGTGNKGDTVIATFPAQNGGAPEVVEVKVDEKGEWSATPTKELKDGANTISVSVKDPAGNVGVVNPAVITINTTKPTATATLDPNSDSGDKGDGITNNTMPKITGKGKEGDTIKVTFPSKDGTPEEKTVTVGKGGTWEVVPTKALKEGENQIGVEVTDKTTGTKTDLPVVKVTVDTTAPTGTTATLDPDSDTGVKGDNITSDTTPTIKGTGNKGDTVIATFPAQNGGAPEVVEVKVDEKGEWSATPTKELKDGANTISVSVKDPAGNVGVVNPAVITINTTKPTATATLDPNSDSGDKGDGITNNTMPKITGKGKEGDTIKVTFPSKDGTPEEKTVTVGKGGTWEVVPTKALKEGENQIGVEVTDKTTGTKTDLPVVKVTVDTTAPTGTTATLDPDSDTGVKGDNITSDTTPTIKGTGNKGDTVIATFPAQNGGAPEVVEVKVDEKGEWSATPTKELKDGANTISVSVKDPAGNVGVVNPAVITINTTKPTAPTPVANSDGSVTADLPKDPQDGDTVTISYTPEQGANKTATLKYDGATKTWKPDPANGDVQVVDGKATLPADKVKDNSLVKVSAADKAGNESPATPATTVSAKAPASAGVQNDGVVDNTGKTAVDEGQTISTKVTLTNANGNPALKLEYTGAADKDDIGTPTFTGYDETNGKITYDATNGTINVPKGVGSFTIVTPINADGKTEAAENITVKVGGVDANQAITINDTSKGAATIDNSANDGVKTKPASEGGNLVTTVKLVAGKETELAITRTAGTATDDDFDTPVYTVTKKADGSTATVGATLTFANGKLTVPAGVTEFTITTPVKTDNLSEGNETVKYTVGGVDGNEAIITDTTPAVAVKSVTNANNATEVNEGASLTTTVTLNRATDKQIELDYKQNLMGSTAEDFTSGKPTFTAGVSLSADGTKLIVPKGVSTFDITTTVKADNVTEATAESFNYTVGGKTSSTVTINDTSKGAATIDNSANDGVKTKPASEGGNLVTTVKLVAGKETELAITRTAGTATDDDFDTPVYTVTKKADGSTATVGATLTFANGKLTVPAGVTEFTITTPVKTDNLSEGNETVKYTVGGVDGNEAIITDTTPAVAVKSVTNANNATEVNEGASLTTTVTLNRATDKQIELDYKQNLMGSTAEDFTSGKPTFTAGVSLSADGTKLIVPKGVSTFDITTTVKADNVTEATAESFNYTVGGKTSSTVTINDTSKGAATIDNSANDGVKTKPASEGGNLVTTVKLVAGKETELAITRTAGTATDDDFDTPVYTVTKKADGSTATVGATLTFANGKLTVPAGVTEFTITTPVKTDNLSEGNETVKYTVGGVDGNEAIITDTTPAVAVKSVTNANNATEVNEGASLTTTVTLNRATDK
ncbi:Ig-like domain-containing protein, partial [Moraxella caprae]|uniref:Ig-like domain-containing protein n=1 Tax=Moraxella caprae TaxID=90240 RepID=UPI0011C07683